MPKWLIAILSAALAGFLGFSVGSLLDRPQEEEHAAAIRDLEKEYTSTLRRHSDTITQLTEEKQKLRQDWIKSHTSLTLREEILYAIQTDIDFARNFFGDKYHISLKSNNACESQIVASWQGSGMKNTDTFKVTKPWLLKWHVIPGELESSNLGISVMQISGSESHPASSVSVDQPGPGESWIYESGTFYLEVTGPFCRWEISIVKPTT